MHSPLCLTYSSFFLSYIALIEGNLNVINGTPVLVTQYRVSGIPAGSLLG